MEDYFEYFCVLKRTYMKRSLPVRFISAAFTAILLSAGVWAGTPQVDVKVTLSPVSGDPVVLSKDNPQTDSKFNAPLRAKFTSSIVADDGKEYELRSQWIIKQLLTGESSDTIVFLKRYENDTEYEFTDFGSFQVVYEWSYREKDSLTFILGDKETMTFSIDESEVRLDYNGFSPNGDGINDVFKIYVRSIVDLKISIFNRWGQTIKTISGRMENILNSPDIISVEDNNNGGYLLGIWDGRFNGDIVNDGVYFINVEATGASGRTFEKRADINVLKGRAN